MLLHRRCQGELIPIRAQVFTRSIPRGVNLRIPADADQHSWVIPITIPA
jgi:hypothetical protein